MRALALVVLAGCSTVLGIDNLEGPSNGPDGGPSDGPTDGPVVVPQTITLSGDVQKADGSGMTTAVASAIVTLEASPGGSADQVISDDNGKFTMIIETGGLPVGGKLSVSVPGVRPTLQFLIKPLVADTQTTLQLFEDQFWSMIGPLCGSNFNPQLPVVLAFVTDNQDTPIEGATIESTPSGNWCGQSQAGGVVQGQTGAGGFAFAFDLPPGPIQIRSGVAQTNFDAPAATNIFVGLRLP